MRRMGTGAEVAVSPQELVAMAVRRLVPNQTFVAKEILVQVQV